VTVLPPSTLPVVGTPTVLLRRTTVDDWPLEQALSRVDDVPRWTFVPPRMTDAQARRWARAAVERAEAGVGVRYVVECDGEDAGVAGIAGLGTSAPAVFYALLPGARGRGLATRAVRSLTGWVHDSGAAEVRLLTRVGNEPSEAVAERSGYRLLGETTDERDGSRVRVWAAAPPSRAGSASMLREFLSRR